MRDIEAKEGDFCFKYTNNSFRHYKSRSNINYSKFKDGTDLPLVQIAFSKDGGVGLTIGGLFMVISYSSAFESTFGDLDEVEQFDVPGVPTPSKESTIYDYSVESTEIWAWQAASSADEQDQNSDNENEFEQIRLTQLSTECRHPWVNPSSPFGLYRSSPVYHVPSHLTLQNVCQIIL